MSERLIVVPCAGVPITACTRVEAAREVIRLATSAPRAGVDIHLCNAYTLALADGDPGLKSILQRAALNFPDGKAVVWANRFFHRGRNIPNERVYGPDLFLDVFEQGQASSLRHFLLGSTPQVLEKLEVELQRRFPAAQIVGTESPPFGESTHSDYIRQRDLIAGSSAQVVWVGLGTPKQDVQVARLASDLPMVFGAVGAAFDFVAGTKRQAPRWMQNRGLEWLFRLVSEPRRLWRRYLFGNAQFASAALRHRGRLDKT